MDLATPAPNVSAAGADLVSDAEAATAHAAVPRQSPEVEAPEQVGPAETVDDPMKYAPDTVKKKSVQKAPPTSVEALRGTSGADFEGEAAVLRGMEEKNCLRTMLPCFWGERLFVAYGEARRYVLIKGENCFVFTRKTDVSPLFAIPLVGLTPVLEDPNNPDKNSVTISPTEGNISKADLATVLLKDTNGRVSYQITFDTRDDREIAHRFVSVAKKAAGEKKGGGGDKTASIVYAEKVAQGKAQAQPEKITQGRTDVPF